MALQECGLNLNRGLRELQPHGTLEFPCAGYSARYPKRQEDMIPWHWHEELELIYVKEGCLAFKVPSATVSVQKGDAVAINSNVLHSGVADDTCELHSLVFSPALVAGDERSVFAKKYMQPLLSCRSFTGFPLSRLENSDIIQGFCRAFSAIEEEPPGFEWIVRENLSRVCFFLTQSFLEKPAISTGMQSRDHLRMRNMLDYIHKNYSEEITLSEIAKAAGIGERECLRCFQKMIQVSPIQYLLKYRMMQGAETLLHHPECSISELSLSCGFESPSNFSKRFKRFYHCTPREYRKSGMEERAGDR